MKLAKPLQEDVAQLSKKPLTLVEEVFGDDLSKYVDKKTYNNQKYYDEVLSIVYDKLPTAEAKVAYTNSLRINTQFIKSDFVYNCPEGLDVIKNPQLTKEQLKFIKNNIHYMRTEDQKLTMECIKNNNFKKYNIHYIGAHFAEAFDDSKIWEYCLKNKKPFIYDIPTGEKLKPLSDKLSKALKEKGIDLSNVKINQPIKSSSIDKLDKSLYYETPYYHGIQGNVQNAKYIESQLIENGATRFHAGPNPNVLFLTDNSGVASQIARGNPVMEFRLRKEMPMISYDDLGVECALGNTFSSNKERNVIMDLLYEKGVKFFKDAQGTIIVLDPKVITMIKK